jgi:hypothetical protein
MPTPINYPDSFKSFYAEILKDRKRELRRKKFFDRLFCFVCISMILFCGLLLWAVTP